MKVLMPGGSGRNVGALAYSPDGSRLAAVGNIGLREPPHLTLWHQSGEQPLFRKPLGRGLTPCVAYSPAGEHIAVTDGRRDVMICDAITGESLHQGSTHGPPPVALSFFPDGRGLLIGSGVQRDRYGLGELIFWARPEYEEDPSLGDSLACYALAWPADGSFFVAALPFGSIHLQSLPLSPDSDSYGTPGHVRSLAVSPDGQYLAAAIGCNLWVYDRTNSQSDTIAESRRTVHDVAFSPDSSTLAIACGDGVVRFRQKGTWKERTAFDWGFTNALCVAFSPDGLTCAAGGRGKASLVIWDLET